jgi:ankyrin repeat protein
MPIYKVNEIKDIPPLHDACFSGDLSKVFNLIEKEKVDVHALDKHGKTALHVAAQEGHFEVLKLLIKKKATIDKPCDKGFTALHMACFGSNFIADGDLSNPPDIKSLLKVADKLIQSGAEVNYLAKNGRTALHILSEKNYTKMAELLINKGADINAPDEKKVTPLHIASQNGNNKMVELLINRGAKIDLQDADGQTPLHAALFITKEAMAGQQLKKVAELLLQKGADVNKPNNNGEPPLHVLIIENKMFLGTKVLTMAHKVEIEKKIPNQLKLAKLLIEKYQANVNLTDNEGDTALHIACEMNNIALVKFLLKKGADVNLTNNEGDTALHIAQTQAGGDDTQIVKLLQENSVAENCGISNHQYDAKRFSL